ncbi:MAG: hypothetical protein FWC62_09585, partial [Firmicutes bacterium]|nr:hypothetical protein [Bacillota bacterium]
ACVLALGVLLGSGALLKTLIVSAQTAADSQVIVDTAMPSTGGNPAALEASEPASSPTLSTADSIASQNDQTTGGQTHDYKLNVVEITPNPDLSRPSAKDLTKEQAAQIAARAVSDLFGRDVTGRTAEMFYTTIYSPSPSSSVLNTSVWQASFTLENGMNFLCTLDSVTGRLYVAAGDTDLSFAQRQSAAKNPDGLTDKQLKQAGGDLWLDADPAISHDPAFAQAARDFVNKLGVGQIASVSAQDPNKEYSQAEIVTLTDGDAYYIGMDPAHALGLMQFYAGGFPDFSGTDAPSDLNRD